MTYIERLGAYLLKLTFSYVRNPEFQLMEHWCLVVSLHCVVPRRISVKNLCEEIRRQRKTVGLGSSHQKLKAIVYNRYKLRV